MRRGVLRTGRGWRARPWDGTTGKKISLGYYRTEKEAGDVCDKFYAERSAKPVTFNDVYQQIADKAFNAVPTAPPKETEYQEINGDTGVFITHGTRITNLDELVRAMKVDLNTWEISNCSISKSEIAIADGEGGVNVEPLFHIKASTRKKNPSSRIEVIVKGALEQIKEYAPVYTAIKKHKAVGGYLLEICIPDLHMGKLCWSEETGTDYNIRIAKEVYKRAMEDLLSKALHHGGVARVVLPIGNDFFHVDNGRNTTTAGTSVDVDSRFQKAYREGSKLLTESIDIIQCHAPVDIIVIPGNHDQERMFYMGDLLAAHYRNCPDVKIDDSLDARKYYDYGKVLLGYAHGNEEKRNDLLGLMATEEPVKWGKSAFREWHIGHFHSKRSSRFMDDISESMGTRVRVIPSLSAPDAWHTRKGFLGARSAEAFLWDGEHGCQAQFFFNLAHE